MLSITAIAQKTEVKNAEKAIKKGDFTEAITHIDAAEKLLSNMDDKTKPKFYFLKGQAFFGKKQFAKAHEAFISLVELENKIGKKKYSDDYNQGIKSQMIQEVSKRGFDRYNQKDYKQATEDFYLTYLMSPVDTSFLNNAALSAYSANDLDQSLKYYKKLKDLGYTGIATVYYAKEKETGIERNLGSKQQRDLMVKTGQYTDPRDEVLESKQAEVVKNIAFILSKQDKNEEAVKVIQEVRAANPDDLNLLLTEADFYIKLNDMEKFGQLMEKAVQLDPNNPMLFYNLGIINQDKEGKKEDAIKYFKRAIELKPDYADAYVSVYRLVVSEEEAINKQMEGLTDFDKYDELQAKKKEIYKKGLPYLEKADSLKRTVETVKVLRSLYEILEDTAKAKEYSEILKKLEQQ